MSPLNEEKKKTKKLKSFASQYISPGQSVNKSISVVIRERFAGELDPPPPCVMLL